MNPDKKPRYQSRHEKLSDAVDTAIKMSKENPKSNFGVIEDHKEKTFFVEEDYGMIRSFETLHHEFENGEEVL